MSILFLKDSWFTDWLFNHGFFIKDVMRIRARDRGVSNEILEEMLNKF